MWPESGLGLGGAGLVAPLPGHQRQVDDGTHLILPRLSSARSATEKVGCLTDHEPVHDHSPGFSMHRISPAQKIQTNRGFKLKSFPGTFAQENRDLVLKCLLFSNNWARVHSAGVI